MFLLSQLWTQRILNSQTKNKAIITEVETTANTVYYPKLVHFASWASGASTTMLFVWGAFLWRSAAATGAKIAAPGSSILAFRLCSRANAGDLQLGPFPSALHHYLHLPAQGTFGQLTASTGLISPLPLSHPFPHGNPVLFFSEMLPYVSTKRRLCLSSQTVFNIQQNVYLQLIYTLLFLQSSISYIFPKFFSWEWKARSQDCKISFHQERCSVNCSFNKQGKDLKAKEKHNSDDSPDRNLPDNSCLYFNIPSATAHNISILFWADSVNIN